MDFSWSQDKLSRELGFCNFLEISVVKQTAVKSVDKLVSL